MFSEFTLKRVLKWLHKGGFAVLDQGLFAGSNFLASILLARWLPAAEYGAFVVAYSIFLENGHLLRKRLVLQMFRWMDI